MLLLHQEGGEEVMPEGFVGGRGEVILYRVATGSVDLRGNREIDFFFGLSL